MSEEADRHACAVDDLIQLPVRKLLLCRHQIVVHAGVPLRDRDREDNDELLSAIGLDQHGRWVGRLCHGLRGHLGADHVGQNPVLTAAA